MEGGKIKTNQLTSLISSTSSIDHKYTVHIHLVELAEPSRYRMEMNEAQQKKMKKKEVMEMSKSVDNP
ncbi:hypothetical protein BLOT_015115 [Blomia tropicalis]|nr:hypothetical protein BLOT_015115 [Blomia tropicalis]